MLIEGSILPSLYYGFQHDRHLMIGYMGKPLLLYSKSELMSSYDRSSRSSNCIYRPISKRENAPLDPDPSFHRTRSIRSNPNNSLSSNQRRPARQREI
jgi:hypothetical protein